MKNMIYSQLSNFERISRRMADFQFNSDRSKLVSIAIDTYLMIYQPQDVFLV
jgi:hypothetical protein